MDSSQKLDVEEWRCAPRAFAAERCARRRYLPPKYVGMLGTLLIHGLAIQSLLPIGQIAKIKPPETQEPAVAHSKAKTDENVVLLTLPNTAALNPIADIHYMLPSLSSTNIKVGLADVDPPSLPRLMLPFSEDQASKPAEGRGDAAEQAQLFGLYWGQIHARIERVWRKPRTPIDERDSAAANVAESFQCQVQIVQDLHGNVEEVLVLACNGSQAWQGSLVMAIQQASPLPAPPSETVFNRSVILNFLGLQYAPGSENDEYELPPRNFAQTAQ